MPPPTGADPRTVRSAIPRYAVFWGTGVAVVGGTYVAWSILSALGTVLTLVTVAAFFAIVLTPLVDLLQRRTHTRRGLAVLAVFVAGLIAFGALGYAFAKPIYDSSSTFTKELPRTIRDAEQGRGDVGRWLKDIGAQKWAHDNLPKLRDSLSDTNGPLLEAGVTVATGLVALITVLVLTFLMLMEGPRIIAFALDLLPDQRAQRFRRVGNDASRAVTGYMAGNLLISLFAGTAIYIWLRALSIPFALVLALWVAFSDLLPLVGATLGAIPVIFVALLDSLGLGIATLIFFIVYQLFENHVLQPTVMSKTVKLNPLGVLLAVLVGVELAGLLGALLAIPIAGVIQVVARDVWQERRASVKEALSR